MDHDIAVPFDAVAESYDDNHEHAQIAEDLVGLVESGQTELIVDVATGTGAAAFAALKVLAAARSSLLTFLQGCLMSPGDVHMSVGKRRIVLVVAIKDVSSQLVGLARQCTP